MPRFAAASILFPFCATDAADAAAGATAGPANPDRTVVAGIYRVGPAHTWVRFTVSHMGFTNSYGDFNGASGSLRIDPNKITATKLEISIPTASVLTTNATLDAELKSAD